MDTTHPSLGQPQGYACRKLRIVDYTLDDADLETRCLLDNGRHKIQPRNSVGQLDVLPLEIVTDVLVALDLPTLTAFRRVNRRAMSLVDSLHQYGTVLKHCPNVLRAIISIDANTLTAGHYTRHSLPVSVKLRPIWWLPLPHHLQARVLLLLHIKFEYLPISATYAAKHTGLSRKELKHLPHILSLPGRYTAFDKQSKNRIMLYDWQVVLNRTSKVSIQSFVERMQEQDHTTREPRRYMSIISAPYFSSLGHSADWGFHCAGCIDDTEPATHFRIRYTRDAILDHIGRHSGKPENQVEGDA